ncbi:MAG: hypothetical protein JSS91_04150 [Bacteroidetes bacterium]|nr:hypothetical protein [Bacteroidota bacterium]
MRKILILSYSNLSTDPRVIRQIDALKDEYSITASGYNTSDIEGVKNIPIYIKSKKEINFHSGYPVPFRKAVSLFVKYYLRYEKKAQNKKRKALERSADINKRYWTRDRDEYLERLNGEKFDIIIANEIETLPMALRIAGGNSAVILDCHEYHPLQFEHDEYWVKHSREYVYNLCAEYLNKADVVFAVSQGIADEYEKNFSVKPLILTNATEYNDLKPSETDGNRIKLIHHGAAIKARNLELMIEMMNHTDARFTLDFMLIPTDRDYYEQLKDSLAKNTKVRLIEPVNTKDIPAKINSYDIGLFILPPVNFNYRHALPNKFFEFVQARLGIAIGPSVEMQKILNRYDLGIAAEDFRAKSMAEKLNNLTAERIMEFKQNAHKYSTELSSKNNKELMRLKVRELLKCSEIKERSLVN